MPMDGLIELSDHGPRTLTTPDPAQTADQADHPALAAAFGM